LFLAAASLRLQLKAAGQLPEMGSCLTGVFSPREIPAPFAVFACAAAHAHAGNNFENGMERMMGQHYCSVKCNLSYD
jgi:hypothetical protein